MRSLSNKECQSAKWYLSISDLPLNLFIKVIVDDNLFALVISGEPTKEELFEAWHQIRLQYADAIKDNEYRLITSLYKEVANLEITYKQIHYLCDTLQDYYTKEFHQELNKLLHSSFKLDVRFPEDYDNDLRRARNRSKGIKMNIDLKKSSLEAMETKKSSKPTKEYFQGLLITLSDHAHYPIHDNITVFEFCERIKRLNFYYEQMKNKK